MAYRFKRKESVSKAIRRLAAERIDHGRECLRERASAEAIHCARKDIKKARAVARLVRSELEKKEYRWLIKRLREAATALAAPRDAYIKAKALPALTVHFKGQLAPGALRRIRAQLRKESDEEMKRFAKGRAATTVERTLRRVGKKWSRLKVSGQDWKALRPGVKTAYCQGQRAYQTARDDSSPENFHEWRKRAKDLWYEVRLLQAVWPEQMEAMAGELETLTEYLGDDHDLTVLREDAEARGLGNAREMATLNGLIDERQRSLRTAALALGARLYAEKASTFCDHLGGYWRAWRRGRKTAGRTASPEASPKHQYTRRLPRDRKDGRWRVTAAPGK